MSTRREENRISSHIMTQHKSQRFSLGNAHNAFNESWLCCIDIQNRKKIVIQSKQAAK